MAKESNKIDYVILTRFTDQFFHPGILFRNELVIFVLAVYFERVYSITIPLQVTLSCRVSSRGNLPRTVKES